MSGIARAAVLIPGVSELRTTGKIAGAARRWASGCGCFEAGTLVATPEGLVPIETIAVGDLVLAQNEATGEIAPKPVTDLIRPEPKPLYALKLRDASGEIETFHATDDHPWKVEGKGWVETVDLKPEDRIDTASGADMVLLRAEVTDRIEHTYNLTVADWHTFLVGEDQAVVHNACRPVGVPSDWVQQRGRKDGHTKWVNPRNPHDYVRVKRDGTITQVRNGKAYDVNGNLVDLRSPEAHGITPDMFRFRP